MDEFLLAINDIDAFCEVVNGNGSGGPVCRNFVKENLDEIIKYPFAYIDDFKSFKAEMTDGVLHATFVTENDVRYTFAYTPRSRLTPVYPNNTVDVLVIDGQSIEMGRRDHPGFGYYSLYGIWKNRDTYVNISITVDYDISSFEELEEFYTVDLRELASQGFGEETIDLDVSETTDEETTDNDEYQPILADIGQNFMSLDDLLLAVEDVDAFYNKIYTDAYPKPICPKITKEGLELLAQHPFPYTDECSDFRYVGIEKDFAGGDLDVIIVFTTENDITYLFQAYLNIEVDFHYDPDKIPDEESCEIKIGDQLVKLHMGSAHYSKNVYRGVWKNGEIYFRVLVHGKNLTSPEDLIDFYTIDLVELASQRFGEETTTEETNDSEIEETT